ncbi:MAG: hypothetical protein JJU20_03540 [Opitutales bacterium]|nr:hypothetical protein [Opitutales bacterium]
MELNFRPVGKTSQHSERTFKPGDRVLSYLYRSENGLVDRVDIHEEEEEQFELPGPLICRWEQYIREHDVSEAELRKQQTQTTEELFLTLAQEGALEDALPEQQLLGYFLAIQLERKRVLRAAGRERYLHIKSKVEYRVPNVEIDPTLLLNIQEQLGGMIR